MTTRNFRVHNGISVGDIVIDASTNKITGGATGAPSADGDFSNKKYVDDSIAAISTTAINQGNSNVTVTDSGTGAITVSADATEVANFAVAATTLTAVGAINLTAGSDVVVPANVGVTFGSGEKIEGDNTNLTVTSGAQILLSATSDVVVPANVGVTFGSGEKIEGNDTDLTVTSGAKINLTATSDVHLPNNVGMVFGDSAEKIEGDGTDLTISGNNINLTAVADIVVPANVGITFGSGEKIEGDSTDLTITSGAKINLTATSDVHIPNNVGIAFGAGGEKIESDGTDLTVTSTGALNLTTTGLTTVSGALTVSGDLTVNGTTTTVHSTNTTLDDNLLELNSGAGSNANDSGIIIERGSTGDNAIFMWDESADKFTLGTTTATASSTGNVSITAGTLVADLEGDATGSSGSCTGNAATATALATARNIGGVSFDGTAAINLPGVNTAGNQNTSGTAAIGTSVTVTANNSANETVYLTFVDGATGTQGIETDTGLSYNPSTNVLSTTASQAQYADVAERFEADAPMEIGSVVEVGGSAEITEATSEMSQDVFGVISHKPAYMMNAGAGSDDSHPFVAMTGRTPVRVTGVVNKGQRLVTSSIKGCARAVAAGESISPFNVIGRALETSTDANIKLVNCAVRTNN